MEKIMTTFTKGDSVTLKEGAYRGFEARVRHVCDDGSYNIAILRRSTIIAMMHVQENEIKPYVHRPKIVSMDKLDYR